MSEEGKWAMQKTMFSRRTGRKTAFGRARKNGSYFGACFIYKFGRFTV